jgi:hypothetical protein
LKHRKLPTTCDAPNEELESKIYSTLRRNIHAFSAFEHIPQAWFKLGKLNNRLVLQSFQNFST